MNAGLYFLGLALAVGLGLPIAVIGAGIGQGLAASGALQGMARQPEMAGLIRNNMIIALAIIESLAIYALLIFFLLQGRLPATDTMLKLDNGKGGTTTTSVPAPSNVQRALTASAH